MNSSSAVTQTSNCPKCGADVRPGSLFCYNCGGPVAEEAASAKDLVGIEPDRAKPELKPAPGARPRVSNRRERGYSRGPKRFVWEPAEDEANTQLLVVAAVIGFIAVLVVIMALYLR